jgi:hypothetical protein
MEKYDYRAALVNDIKEYIKDNPQEWADPLETDDITEYWYDILWAEDCITGNGAYWYAKEEECEEYISHNVDLAFEACQEFGIDMRSLAEAVVHGNAARYVDCTIRCYLLGECLEQALEELNS